MSEPFDPTQLIKHLAAMSGNMTTQVAVAEKQQLQRAAAELNGLDGEIAVLRARLGVVQAEIGVYEADLHPDAPKVDQARRGWLSVKIAALNTQAEAVERQIAAMNKLYDVLLEGGKTLMSTESIAELMRQLTRSLGNASEDQG